MTTDYSDVHPMEDPESKLEQALTDEFMRMRGLDAAHLRALPDVERRRVEKEAALYAASKLAEVDARAHFVHDIHGGSATAAESVHHDPSRKQ